MNSGVDLIAAERARQVSEEGWTPAHDASHIHAELAMAAMAYVEAALDPDRSEDPPDMWPWNVRWWNPSEEPIRNLVKAGALIAAEIDRLTSEKAASTREVA